MLSGYAICVVNLVDTTYNAADDIYEWHLEDVKKIKAFPVKGKLNFFDVDDSLIHYPGEKKEESVETEAPAVQQAPLYTAMPQMPGMPKMIDNINLRVRDDWMLEDELTLDLEGLNMDAVWENFIIQVGGVELEQGNTLDEQIATDDLKRKAQKDIEKLEKQARNEKQPNKKFQLASQVKAMKKRLNELEN